MPTRDWRLLEELVVHGLTTSTRPNAGQRTSRALIENVIRRWPRFKTFFTTLLDCIEDHFNSSKQDAPSNDDAYDVQPYTLLLYENDAWVNSQDVYNPTRARVLALKLEERGYICSFTDSELVVSLPLKLLGEENVGSAEAAEGDFDEEAEEEAPEDGEAWPKKEE